MFAHLLVLLVVCLSGVVFACLCVCVCLFVCLVGCLFVCLFSALVIVISVLLCLTWLLISPLLSVLMFSSLIISSRAWPCICEATGGKSQSKAPGGPRKPQEGISQPQRSQED